MSRELTTFEVLEIAEQMEREAARFYRRAAGLYEDPGISKLFSELAQWEKRHVQLFVEMKDRLSAGTGAPGRFDLDRVGVSRLAVPTAVFNARSEPARELTGTEARADVLRLALEKERHAIGYYMSLTEFALGQDNLRVIKEILAEEQRHVRILAQSLKQVGA
jgi:rubrerythrin